MKLTSSYLLVISAVLLISAASFAAEAPDVVGTYRLGGVMEAAGWLTIKPDHTYRATFSYGAGDWVEVGRWKRDGDGIIISRAHFVQRNSRKIRLVLTSGMRFTYEDGELILNDPSHKLIFRINPSHAR